MLPLHIVGTLGVYCWTIFFSYLRIISALSIGFFIFSQRTEKKKNQYAFHGEDIQMYVVFEE